jgi:hypothetical protein
LYYWIIAAAIEDLAQSIERAWQCWLGRGVMFVLYTGWWLCG